MKIREKGPHTWDIFIRYHRCPHCGVINENREDYISQFGKYVKPITCFSCGERFTDVRQTRPGTELVD